jgi:integrase
MRAAARQRRRCRADPLSIPSAGRRSTRGLSRGPTRLLFPAARGGPIALSPWRNREWTPAVRAAGLKHRTIYALRHTYASLSIAAGVSLFELCRLMGTSPAMLDRTYGHLLPDALDRARTALDAFVVSVTRNARVGAE